MNSASSQPSSTPASSLETVGYCRVLCLACTRENILPALQALEAGGFAFECDFAADVEGLEMLLKQSEGWDIALIRQPGEDILKIEVALARLTAHTPDTPLVVLSSNADEAQACELLAQGVCDVLDAPKLPRLPGIVKREQSRNRHTSLEMLPEQQKLVEQALRENEWRSAFACRIVKMGYWERNLQTEGTHWSEEMDRIFGLTEGHFKGTFEDFLQRFVHPDDRELVANHMHLLVTERKEFNFDHRIIRPDGEIRTVSTQASILCDKQGHPHKVLRTAVDITERKQTEDALRQSQQLLMATQHMARLGYWVRSIESNIIEYSDEMDRIYGFSEGHFDGTYDDFLARFVYPDDRERVAEQSRMMNEEGRPFHFDHRITHLNGQVRTLNVQAYAEFNDEGRPIRVIGTVQDITEQKEAENALRESESRFRSIAEASPITIWMTNPEARMIYLNAKGVETLGGTLEEILARGWPDFVHPDDLERTFEIARHGHETTTSYQYETRFLSVRENEYRWYLVTGAPRFRPDGVFLGFMGSGVDITARKQGEIALLESEHRLLKAQQLAHLGYWDWEISENRLYWSDYVYDIFGLPRDEFEVTYEAMLRRFHPDDRTRINQRMLEFLDNPEQGFDVSFRIVRPNGQIRYVYSQGEMTLDGSGKPIRMSGTHQDVTDLMQAKMALEDSLRFHRAVLDALSMHIAILDEQGTVLDVNQAWRDFGIRYGLDPDAIIGSNYFAACRSDADYAIYAKQALSGIAQVLGGKQEVFSLDYPCEAGGQRFWFRLNVTRFESHDAHGTPFMRLVLSHEDISHRRLADEALSILMSQNEALLNNIPDFAWMKDVEGRYIAINAPCARLLNRPKEETIGKTDFDLWPQPIAFKLRTDDRFVLRTGQRILVESAMDLPDETLLWLETINCPIRNNEGVIIGTVGIARDITNRKEAENIIIQSHEALERMVEDRTEELQEANRSLKETEKLRTNFVSALAHDLRTPLIAQRRLIELLEDQFSDIGGKAAFLAHGLVQNNENLLDMVNKLLETYQYDEGRIEPHWEACHLHHLVEDCYDTVRSMASEKHIMLINAIPMNFPSIVADPSLLRRVFINLLGNALENIASGCHIRIDANEEEDSIVIRVEDNGCGIDPGILPGVFERYFTHSRTRQKIGSGLGLFICKMIVDLHGGMIAVASELGKGTLFTITLPRHPLSDVPKEPSSSMTTDVAPENPFPILQNE